MVVGQISGADKLFIGSRAGYGTTGGALAVYDLSSDTWVNYRSPFTADGIISLVYDPASGNVFGGTTGVKFFKWNTTTNTRTDLENITCISMCLVGNKIFSVDWNYKLRVYNINSSSIVRTVDIPSSSGYPIEIALGQHSDGYIYGLTPTAIYKVHPNTYAVTTVATSPVTITCGWVINNTGIYFGSGTHLWRYDLSSGQFHDLGVSVETGDLSGFDVQNPIVGPNPAGVDDLLYFNFKVGEGMFLLQHRPVPPEVLSNMIAPDLDGDGKVNLIDYSKLARRWLDSQPLE